MTTEKLPTIPTVRVMRTWDEQKVLQWIQQRDSSLLKGNHLKNFKKAGIMGRAFLASDVDFFCKTCRLSAGVGLALKSLVDEVKEGSKFIPRT